MAKSPLDIPTARLTQFCRANRVRRLAIFGSALRDDFSPTSDVDVLIEFESGAAVGLKFFAMQRELSTIFGREVDLNTPNFLSRRFRDDVLREAVDLYVAA